MRSERIGAVPAPLPGDSTQTAVIRFAQPLVRRSRAEQTALRARISAPRPLCRGKARNMKGETVYE